MATEQKVQRGIAVFAFSLAVMAGSTAQAGSWLADAKSGCQVWDPNPQLDELVTWSGACSNGRAEGPGIARWLKGGSTIETDQGAWQDGRQAGQGLQSWPSGRYQGALADGLPNGRGTLTLQRLQYDGEFRDGRPNGTGTLTEGGETVQGSWKDGCLQGGQRKAAVGIPLSACR